MYKLLKTAVPKDLITISDVTRDMTIVRQCNSEGNLFLILIQKDQSKDHWSWVGFGNKHQNYLGLGNQTFKECLEDSARMSDVNHFVFKVTYEALIWVANQLKKSK